MEILAILAPIMAVLALLFAAYKANFVSKSSSGNERMQEIAAAIAEGAGAFLKAEYRILAIFIVVLFALIAAFISIVTAVCFLAGAFCSILAGYFGMSVATKANVRTAAAAKDGGMNKALAIAFSGGSVMGMCVVGLGLLGCSVIYLITKNPGVLFGFSLGASSIALFARVGGGIYTKAADVGADLVGKVEAGIPEDDPRNPATIADNVGDNVGDVAGLGADLLESYVGAILSGVILAIELFANASFVDGKMLTAMLFFPLAFAAVGLISCIIGIASLFIRKKLSDNPHKELNTATYISAGLTMAIGLVIAYFAFKDIDATVIAGLDFNIGWISPWVAAAIGIVAGIVIGKIAEYYTSYDYKPTKVLSHASVDGSALTITQGLSLGMISCMYPCVVLGIAIYGSYLLSGMYGVAAAAIGMLSFVAATVSVDAYGPISDNAGGIAEMSFLEPEVREITDELDAVGNTTAAIGKGFAIGSAALATLAMMTSFIFASHHGEIYTKLELNVMEPVILVGAIVGAALPFMFSGMLINAVAKAAEKMVEEVRRQFREIKGLMEGEVLPDYKTCIEISSQGALKEMRVPAIFCIAFPVVCGFIFGAGFVGGVLVGATISAIMLALFCGNAGGAWDNGKKYIEVGGVEGQKKGGAAHDAAVVGDTVGDPLKDTVGPSLDILIKIMSTISLVTVAAFAENNLLNMLF